MSDLMAVGRDGGERAIPRSAVAELAARLAGELLTARSDGYEDARLVWNGMIDRRPALVVRPLGTADVRDAVNFAREHDLLLAVRGGGHNVAGMSTCDGGIVIDLGLMRAVHVDPDRRRAWVQGGALLGDLDRETQLHGLATPAGVVSDTGVAGLTLGGGLGWLMRKYGLTCDNLVSAEVVTAGGEVVRAGEDENADLLWGLRGGGGNFGVVTTFEFALHPVGPEIALCFVLYPYAEAATVLRFYRDWGAEAPDKISSIAFLGSVPVTDAYPAAIHGQPFVAVMACHCGPVDEGERALQPLRTITRPLLDMSGPTPYVAMQRALDEDYPAHALRYYWKSTFVDGLPDEAIDRLVELGAQMPSALSTIDIWCLGGAVARASGDAGAFGGRSAAFGVNPEANWTRPEDDEANIEWARECWRDMRRFSSGGVYLNFPGFYEEGAATMRATFGGKYDRLVALKARYDPTNLRHLNQNIVPPGE